MVIREKQQRVFNEKFSTSFEDRMVTDGDMEIIDDEHLTYRIFEFKGE